MHADWSICKDWLVITKYLHLKPDYSFFMSYLIISCVYVNIPICNLRIWWRRWFHVWNEEESQRGDRDTICKECKNVIRGVNCLLQWKRQSYSCLLLCWRAQKSNRQLWPTLNFLDADGFHFYKGSLEDHLFSVKKYGKKRSWAINLIMLSLWGLPSGKDWILHWHRLASRLFIYGGREIVDIYI